MAVKPNASHSGAATGQALAVRSSPASHAGGFASLEQRVTTYICYAHVFGDALTFHDLQARCGPERTPLVRQTLRSLVDAGRIVEDDGFFCLPSWPAAGLRARLQQRRELAERVLRENRRLLSVLAWVPFVRLVAVSGSLAAVNAVPTVNGDLDCDLFIITADDSLHLVRFALRLLMKVGDFAPWLGLMSGEFRPCPNFMVEESTSEIENESLYTATESVQVRVLKGQDAYQEFLRRNRWIGRYYAGPWPAAAEAVNRPRPNRRALTRVVLSALNLVCFAALCGASWVKSRLYGTGFSYSVRSELGKEKSLRRSRPVGGGYQVRVRKRFVELYRAHFGHLCTDEYLAFLFPQTTDHGIWANGRLFPPREGLSLDHYDGLLSTGC